MTELTKLLDEAEKDLARCRDLAGNEALEFSPWTYALTRHIGPLVEDLLAAMIDEKDSDANSINLQRAQFDYWRMGQLP